MRSQAPFGQPKNANVGDINLLIRQQLKLYLSAIKLNF